MTSFPKTGGRHIHRRWLAAVIISLPAVPLWFMALASHPAWGDEPQGDKASPGAVKPGTPTALDYVELGRRARHPDQELKNYNQALELDPNLMEAYFWRGITYERLKEYDKARADFNRTISLKPDRAANYVWRAKVYTHQKAYDQALADLNRALALDPKSSWAYCQRGRLHALQGNLDQALEDLDWALILDLFNGEAYFERGKIHLSQKAYDIALSDLSKAIPVLVNGRAWELYYYRAQAYEGLGETAKAQADWDKVKKLNPNLKGK